MAQINITERFYNQDKRYAEAVIVTVPSQLMPGGGRTNNPTQFVQGGDELIASVVEPDTLIQKAYLIIEEAFPVGATLSVTIGTDAFFAAADATVVGLSVSLIEDIHSFDPKDAVIVVGGITGDVGFGKAKVVLDTIHPSLKNGMYANAVQQ